MCLRTLIFEACRAVGEPSHDVCGAGGFAYGSVFWCTAYTRGACASVSPRQEAVTSVCPVDSVCRVPLKESRNMSALLSYFQFYECAELCLGIFNFVSLVASALAPDMFNS